MEEKKALKISLSTFFLILAIIVICVMVYYIYKLNNEKNIETIKAENLNSKVNSLENKVNDLQEKINTISSTINATETNIANNSEKSTENSSVSYIVLTLEDIEAEEKNQQGIEQKSKKITDTNKINSLMEIIDNAILYKEKEEIVDFGDCPPCATIYLSNGEKYTIAAGDQINDGGNIVNLMTKWFSEDGNNKTLYTVNIKLGEYIEKLFNE